MSKISASLMCSNPYTLQSDIQTLENTKIDYLHMDIMDGHFVPNLGFSIDFIQSIRKCTSLPFDFHLMVENFLCKKEILSLFILKQVII